MTKPLPPSSVTVTPGCYSVTITVPVSSGATSYTVTTTINCRCSYSFSVYNPATSGNIDIPIVTNQPGTYIFNVTASNSSGTSDPVVSSYYLINSGYCNPYYNCENICPSYYSNYQC